MAKLHAQSSEEGKRGQHRSSSPESSVEHERERKSETREREVRVLASRCGKQRRNKGERGLGYG